MNGTLQKLEMLRTKANTAFMDWWPLFNAELTKNGLPEAGFGIAKDCWEMGQSPETAGAYIANE